MAIDSRIHYRMTRRHLVEPQELMPLEYLVQKFYCSRDTIRRRIQSGAIVCFRRAGRWYCRVDARHDE